LREFIQFLIVHFRDRESRKLDQEERRIKLAAARLELLEKYWDLRRTGREGDPMFEIAKVSEFLDIPKFDELANAIMDGRVVSVQELPDKKNLEGRR
jgi:hypothetical protein